ncbi:MAG TPA: hypothetical protein VFV92_03935 [Candidatus Bathyarchaeia archaeon]|nr:hypothetical protein [Candidatus Bathyarchaeia archaeon]
MSETRDRAQLIKRALARRDREHRLRPSLRLKTIGKIVEFVHDRGIVSVLGGNELPSFISAVLGKSWKPSGKGFKGWLDWWSLKISGERLAKVSGEIERRNDIVATRIFRRSKTLVSDRLWPIIDPIAKYEREHERLSPLESKLLQTIEREESIRTDRLRKTVTTWVKTPVFHRSLANLESYMLIVGAEDPHPERHLHANIWQTWESRTGAKSRHSTGSFYESVSKLLEETIKTCVIVKDAEVGKWFRWREETEKAKSELLTSNKIRKVGTYLIPPL